MQAYDLFLTTVYFASNITSKKPLNMSLFTHYYGDTGGTKALKNGTDMEKQYIPATAERDAQELWSQQQTYTMKNNPGPVYSIDTPPPTVSGSLHIGHVFSYTQTDIFARFKRMSGLSVFYPFGFDDNGLPTERFVEKKLSIRAHEMSRSVFIKACQEESSKSAQNFVHLWQRMGLSIDWRKCYSTISDAVRKLSQESFIRLYEKEYVYRRHEPALYCTACRTSVAQAELDDKEQASLFNDIIFHDQHGTALTIGTTRPELLYACVALFYHPDDTRYQYLAGTKAIVPLYGHPVPILADEMVDPAKGTGLVMCCTFGDKTDIAWFKKYTLPYRQAVGLDGRWVEKSGVAAGLKASEARKAVLEALRTAGQLRAQRDIAHTVNVHERCKNAIEYVLLSQWFVNILDHKKELIACADRITWYPAFMKTRYKDWVENLSWDWCISRQRMYGIPFPAWHCAECSHTVVARIQDLPLDPQETPYLDGACPACGSTRLEPDTDVMDTWNTSSLTPYICYEYYNPQADSPFDAAITKDFLPMSMRAQAHDIIRTWAFYTIVKTWMHHGTVPWQSIVISGHVLSDDRQKISKSKGGASLTPELLLDQYPADAIRYWTASGGLGQDVAFSENQLKIGQRLLTKLWNAFRFIEPHVHDVSPVTPPWSFGTVNEWILHQAYRCYQEYAAHLQNYEGGIALGHLERFFWHDVCDTYLELIKHQLFNPDQYSTESVNATRWTLYHVGLRILQMYAPYIPHVTEAIYGLVYQKRVGFVSLHQTRFSRVQSEYVFEKSAAQIEVIIALVGQVRRLKTERALSLKVPLQQLTIYAPTHDTLQLLQTHAPLIKGITQAERLEYRIAQSCDAYLEQQNELWYGHVMVK